MTIWAGWLGGFESLGGLGDLGTIRCINGLDRPIVLDGCGPENFRWDGFQRCRYVPQIADPDFTFVLIFMSGSPFLVYLFRTLVLWQSPYHFRTKVVDLRQLIDNTEEVRLSG
jgi:hypothetical protein